MWSLLMRGNPNGSTLSIPGRQTGPLRRAYADELRAEQVRLLFQQGPNAYFAILFNAALLGLVMWRHVPAAWLVGWLIANLVLTAVRYHLVGSYRRAEPPPDQASRWGRRFVTGALLSGCLWGAAGGMTTLAAYRGAYLAFVVPSALPYGLRAMAQGGDVEIATGAMYLLFVMMMCIISRNMHRTLTDSLLLRFQNADLLRALQISHMEMGHRVEARTEELARSNAILEGEKERIRVTLASIGDAVVTTDAMGRITFMNPAAERVTGWTQQDVCGMPLTQTINIQDEVSRQPMEDPIRLGAQPHGRSDTGNHFVMVRRDNQEISIEQSVASIRDSSGDTIGAVLVFRDVTEQRRVARTLSHQATHDALTGLVNRQEFERRVVRVLTSASVDRPHSLLYLDLDHFKVVNDTSGHSAGDELLRQVAALLQSQVRVRDTLARLGGDEFGILLEHCSQAEAFRIANTLRDLIHGFRFGWEDKSFSIGVSIGLLPIVHSGETLTSALRAADSACYAAKEKGRNRVHVHESEDT